jgi:phosphoribosylaminoimidazole (AIR) synthetase
MVAVVDKRDADRACSLLRDAGETVWRIGWVRRRRADEAQTVVV